MVDGDAVELERAEAGARDLGPAWHGAGVQGEHGERTDEEHILGQPRAAGQTEAEFPDSVPSGGLENGVERGGPDGGVRGDGEAAKEERPGVEQRLRELGLVEGERVDAVEEGGDAGAEVAGGSGKRGGGADREAVDDGAQDIIVEVGEAIGAHGGRASARGAAAAGASLAGAFAGRGARHRSRRGEGLVRWGEWIWVRDCRGLTVRGRRLLESLERIDATLLRLGASCADSENSWPRRVC
jgi:hypothetical protein